MADAKNKFDYTKLNTLAVVSLASAITLFGAPAAVLTGHVSLAQLKDSNQKGRWMAITGLVLGYLAIASAILFTVVGIVLRVKHGFDLNHRNPWHDLYLGRDNRFDDGGPAPLPFPTDPMPTPTGTEIPMPGTN
jgi:hypothetical protein